ncbi:lytic polysaccharide monooxygenase [Catenuloplanes atrovinosus]|uniref:Chitin-binding protein n=1 Tax=Catenuloplanes atrovinosus TaxID=137266 RepID=A0AAE3YLT3_9ACTN|nr:lytic polysaccharide monooxygenase [Catenuloplanes atrovinosus]MDR7276158.1 chitin-binding protein [Catenuloplanes atrovinosus]
MRRTLTTSLLALGTVAGSLVVASPASAHGYISSPPSRQANCASGAAKNCGNVQYEPQSVEGTKGLASCDGGLSQFSALNDDSRGWPVTNVGTSTTFTWVLTARHKTSTWQYFVGGKKVAEFNDNGAQPAATVRHQVNLSGYSGKIKMLAVWNIADTPMAFYNCVDLNVGGTGGTTPANPAPANPAPANPAPAKPQPEKPVQPPAATPSAGTSKPAAGNGNTGSGAATDWKSWTAYKTGDKVTFNGVTYECRQGHTTLPGWEPPLVLALWLPVK